MTVPALPFDTRYIAYTPGVATTDFDVDFPVFGDETDLLVVVGGTVLTPVSGYALFSHSGRAFATIRAPVTDAFIRLAVATTLKVEIYGLRSPRRTAQATTPYSIDDFNQAFTDIVASLQEHRRDLQSALGVVTALSAELGYDITGIPGLISPVTLGPGGQYLISSGSTTAWGTTRGFHYDDYFRRYGTHLSAMQHLVTDVFALAAAGTPCSVDGDGILVILPSGFDVAVQAGKSGVTIATPVRFHNFNFRCDPAWPQPTFATIFGGVFDRMSATITGIADTSALVVGQMIEHYKIPRFSTIASKTSSSITLTNQWFPPQPTQTAGLTLTGAITNGSKLVTGLSSANTSINAGLAVSGSGIPASTFVDQIVLTFTMSGAASQTATNQSATVAVLSGPLQVSYSVKVDIVNGSTGVTIYYDDATVITNGMILNGAHIPSNVTLSARTATQFTMTKNASATNGAALLTFGPAYTDIRALKFVTGDTTANSRTVINASSTAVLKVGQVIDGTQIPRCDAIDSVDSSTQFSLSRVAWGTQVGKVFNYRDDQYLLDFSSFGALTYLMVDRCTFDGADVGNAIRMCRTQNACSVDHNWFVNHVYWGVRNWSKNGGAFTCERNRFYGSNITYNGNDTSRLAIHITTAGSDGKIFWNQGQGFLFGIVVADGAFVVGNHFWNSGGAPVYLQQDNGRVTWALNYVDTGGLELSNEGNAADPDFTIGNANIVLNFVKTGQAPTVTYIKARPCANNTPLTHINISNNLSRQTGTGSGSAAWAWLTGVDTTNGDLDYSNFTAVYARNNQGPGLIAQANPLMVRKNETVSGTSHTIDLTNLFPFNGQPNYAVGGVQLQNASTPASIQNLTVARATRVVTITTGVACTGDLCFEINCNVQASPPQAAATSIFMDSQ